MNKFSTSQFQLEKIKIIKDAKMENLKYFLIVFTQFRAKREKRMLRCKVSKLLKDTIPSLKLI